MCVTRGHVYVCVWRARLSTWMLKRKWSMRWRSPKAAVNDCEMPRSCLASCWESHEVESCLSTCLQWKRWRKSSWYLQPEVQASDAGRER